MHFSFTLNFSVKLQASDRPIVSVYSSNLIGQFDNVDSTS